MTETAHILAPCSFELKFDAGNGAETMSFTGYGAVFKNVDAYGDTIEPGAFADYLADVKAKKLPWPAMLSQHGGFGFTAEDMTPVGIWTDLAEDGHGLMVSGKLADTPRGRELYALMKMAPRPAIDGLSIGYIPKEWEPRSKPEDPKRRLKRLDLVEISPVTFPANGKARVAAVKADRPEDVRAFETALRERMGLSSREAKRVASAGWHALMRQDASDELHEAAALLRESAAAFQLSR